MYFEGFFDVLERCSTEEPSMCPRHGRALRGACPWPGQCRGPPTRKHCPGHLKQMLKHPELPQVFTGVCHRQEPRGEPEKGTRDGRSLTASALTPALRPKVTGNCCFDGGRGGVPAVFWKPGVPRTQEKTLGTGQSPSKAMGRRVSTAR